MPHSAILARQVFVGEHHVKFGAILLMFVWPAGEIDDLIAFDAAGARIDGVGADAGEIIQIKRKNFSRLGAGHAQFYFVFARVNVGEKGFQAVGDEFHRAP